MQWVKKLTGGGGAATPAAASAVRSPVLRAAASPPEPLDNLLGELDTYSSQLHALSDAVAIALAGMDTCASSLLSLVEAIVPLAGTHGGLPEPASDFETVRDSEPLMHALVDALALAECVLLGDLPTEALRTTLGDGESEPPPALAEAQPEGEFEGAAEAEARGEALVEAVADALPPPCRTPAPPRPAPTARRPSPGTAGRVRAPACPP
jgi:hypothetical protein